MYNNMQFILMPLIGAFIGWATNLLAIKLLFRPIQPVKIPFTPFVVQGVIPKRKEDISRNIAEALEKEIISSDEIVERLTSDKIKDQLLTQIKKHVFEKVSLKLPGFLSGTIKNILNEIIDKYGVSILNELEGNIISSLKGEINLQKMVEEKINSFDFEQLENIIIQLAKSELKQIEVLGGVIGFFVGLIQAGVSYLLVF